jgi:allantoinase
MSASQRIVRGRRVFTEGKIMPASIHILDGKIQRVGAFDDVPEDCHLLEAAPEALILPGLVDTHVHVNEPGRSDWEGFASATRAAAAGGVTTIVDMPLNSIPPTISQQALSEKKRAAGGQCWVDVGFWGGLVPDNAGRLTPLWDSGVIGFKCFLIDSGVPEFPPVTEEKLREALPELATINATVLVHAELTEPIEKARETLPANGPESRQYETFLRSRPRAAENSAVELLIRLACETGVRFHVVHHSSADVLPLVRSAREAGLPLTLETCPHYLCIAAEDIPAGATEFKCCPPIRERANNERLWSALSEGVIDMIVSDHSPCPPQLKKRERGDFLSAWGGIASLQLRLPLVWTEAKRRGYGINRLVEWLARAPARLAGLENVKGFIQPGADADLVIWDPEVEFTVAPEMLFDRHKLTPYAGRRLKGVVRATLLRGSVVYKDGTFQDGPSGLLLSRERN